MKISKFLTLFFLAFIFFTSCNKSSATKKEDVEDFLIRGAELRIEKLSPELEALKPKFRNFGSINPGDWMENHNEKGQTCKDYKTSSPNKVTEKRNKIYIWQIGTFTEDQKKIFEDTTKYMEACFNVPVVKLSEYSLNKIPLTARRRHREWMHEQLNAKYILNNILLPNRPDDALALIAFTAKDLYPSESWNFVFGLASLTKRIGVWSMFRNGDPGLSQAHYMQYLRRTISTAKHETAHVLGIRHCIAYECVMCGSNSREESDRRGLVFCPLCMDKLLWNTEVPVKEHLTKLFKVSRSLGLIKESKFFAECLELLPQKVVDN
ncbi:MAG: archaemetzincin [Lentisphaerales bacterium]|nr:archaemetzincin [Lentisphaerales bacterium]